MNRLASPTAHTPPPQIDLDLELGELPPSPAPPLSTRDASLPSTRTDLGGRHPIFQPIVHLDPEPAWEEDPATPARVSSSSGRTRITRLTLALLTTLVASGAMPPAARDTHPPDTHPPETHSQAIPLTAEAPVTLLEKLDRLLRADSIGTKQMLVTSPDSIKDSTTIPWAPAAPLTTLPSRYDTLIDNSPSDEISSSLLACSSGTSSSTGLR